MAEYIEREALIHAMKMEIRPPFAVVRDFPAADVAPVQHGRWILVDKSYGEYECSVCHARDSDCSDAYGAHIVLEQKYCPHCGAKMILEGKA